MNTIKATLVLTFIALQCTFAVAQSWTTVPSTSINLYDLLETENEEKEKEYPAFEMSSQILFKDYKVFLNELKKDSSEEYYTKHLPDSSICLELTDYQEYLTNSKFENSAVAGITWEAALNYCAWKTLKDNVGENLDFYYRLPLLSEWLIANKYLNDTLTNDFSDWTMNAFDEPNFDMSNSWLENFDYEYFHKTDDPPVLKRKHYKGRNFLYKSNYPYKFHFGLYGYTYEGYRHVSFRLVKVKNTNQEKTKENLLKY